MKISQIGEENTNHCRIDKSKRKLTQTAGRMTPRLATFGHKPCISRSEIFIIFVLFNEFLNIYDLVFKCLPEW